MLNKKAVDFAMFQAKMAMAGFETKLTPKCEIRGIKRGAKLGKADDMEPAQQGFRGVEGMKSLVVKAGLARLRSRKAIKSANNPNFKTNSLASLS